MTPIEVTFPSGRTVTIQPVEKSETSKPWRPPRNGLGDWTEALLKRAGVTQDRYKAAKEALGMAPTCNCAARKEWLNKVGAWLSGS